MSPAEITKTYEEPQTPARRDFIAPYIVLGLECSRPLAGSGRYSLSEVDSVVLSRGTPRRATRVATEGAGTLELHVPDSWMSGSHARLERTATGFAVVDTGSKNGTFINGIRIERCVLKDGDLIEVGNTVLMFRDAVKRSFREPADLEITGRATAKSDLQTLSIAMGRRLDALVRVASSSVAVLLTGETGTGKEVAARAVHRRSGRAGQLIAVNCGALTPSLIESELFGHRKGAFSGAHDDHPGLIRAAHGGTLFLDEVAELPETSQVKLLRVLQEREVVPVGETRPVAVDIRCISATHQDLSARVEDGRFRRDLYARLAGFETELLPLRERREDMGVLVAALLPRIAPDRAARVQLQRAAGRALFEYDWPLNIRELEQALTAALALAGDEPIGLEHLPPALRTPNSRPADTGDLDNLPQVITALLRECDGNISAVARKMGKARVQIRRWCKRFDIDPKAFRRKG